MSTAAATLGTDFTYLIPAIHTLLVTGGRQFTDVEMVRFYLSGPAHHDHTTSRSFGVPASVVRAAGLLRHRDGGVGGAPP